MDEGRNPLKLELKTNTDPDLQKILRQRRLRRRLLAIILVLLILSQIALQYYLNLRK